MPLPVVCRDGGESVCERSGTCLEFTCVDSKYLFRSQFGEDRVLWRVFRGRPWGYFVEVGAYDGITLSNTYFLEQRGWTGILIEPIQQLFERAAALRRRSHVVHAACGRRGSSGVTKFTVAQNVPVLSFLMADEEHRERCVREGATLVEVDVPFTTVGEVLVRARNQPPPSGSPWRNGGWGIDVVSIDTEGCELDVLDGFDLERFRPRVLVLENDRPTGQAIEPYLAERGYRKFHRQKINDFYVRAADANEDLALDGFDAEP